MEVNTRALEVVCQHFRTEFGDQALTNLRKRINRAHVENCRLRKRMHHLSTRLEIETSLKGILHALISILLRRLDSISEKLAELTDDV